jgi:methylaspartate mutase epsilon subunit
VSEASRPWPVPVLGPGEPPAAPVRPAADFGAFVTAARRSGALVVQPRMGFSAPEQMRCGLLATKAAEAVTVGTLTLDSYTRVGDLDAVAEGLRRGTGINGYPIVNHDRATTRLMLDGIHDPTFPVQVRHGSAQPYRIVQALLDVGLNATEGGPVSYCLPYGRVPLQRSVREWDRSTKLLAERPDGRPHLETFGGCMLGQLCPPSLLVALSVLEAVYFHRLGITSISVSYAQQTDMAQDTEAVLALRALCARLLPGVDWHVVLYTYMGVYPVTAAGAYGLLGESVRLAARTGAERLIVKTLAESRRIPTIEENIAALEYAAATWRLLSPMPAGHLPDHATDSETYAEAWSLVRTVLDLHDDVGQALLAAFRRGLLDVPFCLHPDNRGSSRSYIDDRGRLSWAATGDLAIGKVTRPGADRRVGAFELLDALSYIQRSFDERARGPLGHEQWPGLPVPD